MSHLTERIAEFVFGELSPVEMSEGHRHLADCSDCREQVQQFQQTYAILKTSSDVEPPRRIIFEVEKSKFMPWMWRWLAPMAASAAVALAVVNFVPRMQPIERVVVQQQPVTQPVAQPINYDKIISELRTSQQTWLANELKKREVVQSKEIQRLQGDLALLDSYQRVTYREMAENASSIQMLAQRADSRE